MSTDQERVIVVDAGNTNIKFGVFENGELIIIHRTAIDQIPKLLIEEFCAEQSCVLSSVASPKIQSQLMDFFDVVQVLNVQGNLPFVNCYKSETLGMDRACNAAAIAKLNEGGRSVSIDVGTCIKFDFVDEKGNYLGGSISPGIHLRYKSLNDYTANLPLIKTTDKVELVGDTTELAIASGVLNGMQAEINDMIQQYSNKFPDLTFFVTGGDAKFFDFERKNNIFANENLTLWGIYYVYQENV